MILSELTEVAASAGAACHSDEVTMSPTLEAMHVPVDYAMGDDPPLDRRDADRGGG